MRARLHLDPADAAPAGLVRAVERLDHHALVAGGERLLEEALRLVGVARLEPRGPEGVRHALGEAVDALGEREVEQVAAVQVEAVEEERRQGDASARSRRRRASAEPAHRHLEGCGRPSGRSAITSPSSTIASTGSDGTAATTSGTRSVTSARLRV